MSHARPPRAPRPALRLAGILLFTAIAVTLIVFLAVGIESRVWRLVALALACAAVTTVVILVPAGWRARGGFIAATFVGAAGVLPMFVNDKAEEPAVRPERAVNVNYLGVLLRGGPIPDLPYPLKAGAIGDTRIADAGAAKAVATLKVDIVFTAYAEDQLAVAFIELYRTKDEAATRAAERFEGLKAQYDNPAADGDSSSFCVDGSTHWVCGGTRGYVYVEDTVTPASNANRALASSTVGVILTYCDDQTLRAIT
ncbi:MAG TPA: hypothetical protein VF062_27485 [Candidatus Limnocylindrales bacterium]